jgi:hypothetical protein
MEDKQEIIAKGKESQAAGRDIINGLGRTEIQQIVQDLLNIIYEPRLQLIVSEYMHKNMQTFAKNLLNIIDAKSLSEKISSSPDLAFVINKTIRIVGEKGENLDLDILLKLIENRINSNDNSFLDIVIEQSIEKVDKLISKQIALLTHIHVIQNISFKVTTSQDLDDIFKNIMPLVEDSFDISEANKKYLASLGLLEINILKGNNTKDKFYKTYKYLDEKLNKDKFIIKYMELDNFENLKKIYMNYEINELYQLHLTTIGEMIALSHLKKIYPNLNVETWIK